MKKLSLFWVMAIMFSATAFATETETSEVNEIKEETKKCKEWKHKRKFFKIPRPRLVCVEYEQEEK